MPRPGKGEDKGAFISRCVRALRKEGESDQKAILGKCYGIWRGEHPSTPKKES